MQVSASESSRLLHLEKVASLHKVLLKQNSYMMAHHMAAREYISGCTSDLIESALLSRSHGAISGLCASWRIQELHETIIGQDEAGRRCRMQGTPLSYMLYIPRRSHEYV